MTTTLVVRRRHLKGLDIVWLREELGSRYEVRLKLKRHALGNPFVDKVGLRGRLRLGRTLLLTLFHVDVSLRLGASWCRAKLWHALLMSKG